jgi:transposase
MEPVTTISKYRRQLENFMVGAPVGKEQGRAQALLWLAKGRSVEEIAGMFKVSQPTIYNWVRRFGDDQRELHDRLADAPRPGRPRGRRQMEVATADSHAG